MIDVRGRLGIRAVESKVQKRMLERIGQLFWQWFGFGVPVVLGW